MYISNKSKNVISIFDGILKPGEERMFFFPENVVQTKIKVGNVVIFSRKLPSDIGLKIDDHNVTVDKHLKFEYFSKPSYSWLTILQIIVFVVLIILFIFFLISS